MAGDGGSLEVLSEGECWELLGRGSVGRLGICYAGAPDIFPVNYVVDERTLVFRTEAGTKLAGATLSPAVAFEVDELDPARRLAWSVVARGRATEIETLDGLLAAEELPLDPWVSDPKTRWVRLGVDELSGRRIVR